MNGLWRFAGFGVSWTWGCEDLRMAGWCKQDHHGDTEIGLGLGTLS